MPGADCHHSVTPSLRLRLFPCLTTAICLRRTMHLTKNPLIALITLAFTLTQAGELKYSIVPNFFEHIESLGPCHGGTVIDKAGNIYVTTDTERGIAVFSSNGKFLRAVGPT